MLTRNTTKLEVDEGKLTTVNVSSFSPSSVQRTLLNTPAPIVLAKCWKLNHWNTKKLPQKLTEIPKNAT